MFEQVFKPLKVETFEEDGILVLEFGETLPSGPGVLAIGFEGILNDKMKGFYRRYSSYVAYLRFFFHYIYFKNVEMLKLLISFVQFI